MIIHATIKIVAAATRSRKSEIGLEEGVDPWFKGHMPIQRLNEIVETVSERYPHIHVGHTNGNDNNHVVTLVHPPSFPSDCFPTRGHYDDFVITIRSLAEGGTGQEPPIPIRHAEQVRSATRC